MSRTFFTSDLHLGHARIVELSHRPFADLEGMEDEIVARWRSTVGPRDIVWVLGDLTIDSQWKHGLEVMAGLPGRKRLVSGNHDQAWPGKRDFHQYLRRYLDVFETVTPFARIRVNGQPVMLSHFPYDGDHTDGDRFTEYRLRDAGIPLLCGHVHGAWRTSPSHRGTPILNVGVDVNQFAPVGEDQVAAWLRSVSRP